MDTTLRSLSQRFLLAFFWQGILHTNKYFIRVKSNVGKAKIDVHGSVRVILILYVNLSHFHNLFGFFTQTKQLIETYSENSHREY